MPELLDTLWCIHNDPSGKHEQTFVTAPPQLSLAEGQALQLALLQRWLDQGESLGGWKIGMTSGASRNAMGDGIRPFGFILASRIKTSDDNLSVNALHRGQMENELCFLMGSELAANATATDAINAVEATLPAFEINQKRLPPDSEPGLRVADNLSNWGIVIGAPSKAPTDLSELCVTLSSQQDSGQQETIESVPSHDHIDDHYESLATLARTLAGYGHGLTPGQYVITGAYGKTPFAPGTYTGHFDLDIGDVTAHLVA